MSRAILVDGGGHARQKMVACAVFGALGVVVPALAERRLLVAEAVAVVQVTAATVITDVGLDRLQGKGADHRGRVESPAVIEGIVTPQCRGGGGIAAVVVRAIGRYPRGNVGRPTKCCYFPPGCDISTS